MSTAKRLMHDSENDGYFEGLSAKTQDIVKDAILKAANDRNGPEGYKGDDDALESVECRSRDGFSPFSHNKGGLIYRNFTNLADYWGGGHTPTHKGAAKEIERQIDASLKDATEYLTSHIGKEDMEYYFGGDKSKIDYNSLTDLEESLTKQGQTESAKKVGRWLNELQDTEIQCMGGDENSIMHELQFMYHGKENGMHSASVSAALNTEGPYHRSSIPWASGVFCEGAKEIEITWRNNAELKRKLEKAFSKVSKEIF